MKNILAKELQELVLQLRALNTPVGEKAAFAIERMGHGFNWTGRKKRPWTVKELRYVNEHKCGYSRKAIAQEIGRTVESVNYKIKELKRAERKATV